ncbi:Eco57I restriction-modification methylase domain-containing protein [Bradyrhizobium japonicum]|uniref:Eco57I restriction-modification methylase domain-containing protein n=1 Tax=Bradyrhizobium japonicum TaxID=375 RepID=UPI001BAC143C|nr:DNA methyltransferase [Bradyrhizobium japonicum]MBR0958381.1 N-6 DNA methylase [Bradyrhizobium japonicum]
MQETYRDPALEWLDHVQPVGLVVAPAVVKDLILEPTPQSQIDSAEVELLVDPDPAKPALADPWAFAEGILGWEARMVAGAPGGPVLPDSLSLRLPEYDTTLSPDWAVLDPSGGEQKWQILVRLEGPGIDPDRRGALDGWEATPHQRFERLLRETGVSAGLMITDKDIRLVYAPKGETSGWLAFPIRSLATVGGRAMLGGLKLMLDRGRLFTDAEDRRLPAVLKKSREAQAAVSTALAEQVLGALHELLRGLNAADPDAIRTLATEQPGHLYEGLLTVLMRLVFVLYAEDRDLLPSRNDGRSRALYDNGYSVRGLYAKLAEDAALNPDTMDERRGGWGRLLALFRLIHGGHSSHLVQARGGKLFDPDAFPFLEGRWAPAVKPAVITVSDGCILRVLEGLMTLESKGRGSDRARERLSYRTLDVEQIGSVYETVMGFTVERAAGRVLAIKAGKSNRTPVFVNLDELLAKRGKDRVKYLKDDGDRAVTAAQAKPIEAAKSVAEIVAALDSIIDERASPRKREISPGTPILQPTDERRRTGSHYTPRSLTEPIVRYALEPAFERLGPDATSEQILNLKVCDPAMGSGAFLVEACRAIAAKLVAAWARRPDKRPIIPVDEDEELHARRLVAQRCLYGVDKNPLATDLAKLSLWLATLARDHEFTFLDHALKSGDSLVGLTEAQIAATHWDASQPPTFVGKLVSDHIREAEAGRREIRELAEFEDEKALRGRLRAVDAKTQVAKLIGDGIVAAFFAEDKPRARIEKLVAFQKQLQSGLGGTNWSEAIQPFVASLRSGAHAVTPFHWEIEFPEVFARQNGGFDAVVGNPPFLGGSRVSSEIGDRYLQYILSAFPTAGDKTDLVLYFFARSFALLRDKGIAGLVATNTIAQGDSRSTLRILKSLGFHLFRARRRLPWPGDATVIVSVLHLAKLDDLRPQFIDDRSCAAVSVYLKPNAMNDDPEALRQNAGLIYEGFGPYGAGFILQEGSEELAALMSDSRYHDIVFEYVGGEDVLTEPTGRSERKIIYIGKMERADFERRYPAAYRLIERTVKEERAKKSKRVSDMPWWQFLWPRPELRAKMNQLTEVLVRPRVAKHHAFMKVPAGWIISGSANVICSDRLSLFGALQSRAHELWSRFFSSTLEDRLRYTPSDCFDTFPFASGVKDSAPPVEDAGQAYHRYRSEVMVARKEGMTKIYNRFHDRTEASEDIRRLRELHAAMDRAVLETYGADWHDIAARAQAIFLDETNEDDHTYQGRLFWPSDFRDEVLARLLALNAERHAEEVRLGIAPGVKGKKSDDEVGFLDLE